MPLSVIFTCLRWCCAHVDAGATVPWTTVPFFNSIVTVSLESFMRDGRASSRPTQPPATPRPKYDLEPARVHTHIGSGSDPAVWQRTSGMSLDLVKQLPTVKILNLGGGYKVGRMSTETSTDLGVIGAPVRELFESFAKDDGRELKLEIEPGTFLVANSASLLTTVQDVVSTGGGGFDFLKLDSGMTELLRPSLYGSQHPAVLVPHTAGAARAADGRKYVAVGHCCESGDLVTPEPDEAETLGPRALGGEAQDGDLLVIEGAGAYCSSMCTKNYNSFPEAPEVMLDGNGAPHIIRKSSPSRRSGRTRWRTRRAQARPGEANRIFLISDDRDDSRQASRGTAAVPRRTHAACWRRLAGLRSDGDADASALHRRRRAAIRA